MHDHATSALFLQAHAQPPFMHDRARPMLQPDALNVLLKSLNNPVRYVIITPQEREHTQRRPPVRRYSTMDVLCRSGAKLSVHGPSRAWVWSGSP